MAKTMFSHSRKGDIKDFYNIADGELGRSVCSFVCFSVVYAGLSVICFDKAFIACGIELCKLCQHWRSLSATDRLFECSFRCRFLFTEEPPRWSRLPGTKELRKIMRLR